jgi:hypothetical protein
MTLPLSQEHFMFQNNCRYAGMPLDIINEYIYCVYHVSCKTIQAITVRLKEAIEAYVFSVRGFFVIIFVLYLSGIVTAH